MDPRIQKSVIVAAKDIFQTMVSLPLEEGSVLDPAPPQQPYDFSGVIGLNGPWSGAVTVHFSKPLASRVATALLGQAYSPESQEVRDTVAEMTNMIAGGMRNELSKDGIDFDISIPTVISGDKHSTNMKIDAPTVAIQFNVEKDPFVVEVAIKMK